MKAFRCLVLVFLIGMISQMGYSTNTLDPKEKAEFKPPGEEILQQMVSTSSVEQNYIFYQKPEAGAVSTNEVLLKGSPPNTGGDNITSTNLYTVKIKHEPLIYRCPRDGIRC